MTLWDQAKEETGVVFFFEGIFCGSDGDSLPIVWAESPFDNRIRTYSRIGSFADFEIDRITEKRSVTSIDLSGLEAEDAIFIIDAILRGRYYDRPGVRGKHDSALYLLVNEAISTLSISFED
jgi:hypothetical protein